MFAQFDEIIIFTLFPKIPTNESQRSWLWIWIFDLVYHHAKKTRIYQNWR